MRILAIETSQRGGSVALLRDPRAERAIDVELVVGRHDEDLIPAIDRLLDRTGIARNALTTVAVSVGPGGFTGLRVGVATAKMLGWALGIPLVPVPTALVVAEAIPRSASPLLVALATKDDCFWATRVAHDGSAWGIEGTPGAIAAADILLEDFGAIAGDRFLPPGFRTRAERAAVTILEPSFGAEMCAKVGARFSDAGKFVAPEALAPIYARPPEVTIRGT